ncbi:chemotaxis protein CheW [Ramlibacter sp. MAHUQ-53]|uniref:chemotaxis protein CheW n=1 Tax=unclassified Ramlibacter TaxID=2617605 RepID=UPI00362B1FB2
MELVIFELGGSRFAAEAARVSKVMEILPVTPLPYAPADVEGLVNVSGAVLLKVDLAARLHQPARSARADGNLLVILTGGETVVAQVDRVLGKISLEEGQCNRYPCDGTGPLVVGEFQDAEGMVLLLDLTRLGLQDMQAAGVPEGGGGLLGLFPTAGREDTETRLAQELQTVTVTDGGEVFAFHMDCVREIVEIRGLTALPGAAPEVDGLMQLRGQALMVLSLARLLHWPQQASPRFVLVISVGGSRLGISVSEVVGIERYARDDVQPVTGGDGQLEGYLSGTGAHQGRMTGLIATDGLISADLMARCKRYLTDHGLETGAMGDPEFRSKRRVLGFRLGSERCALPLSLVDRVEEFTPGVDLPRGDDDLAGVIQIKGEVTPVLDLREMLGVTPQSTGAYIVVRLAGGTWALVVDKVDRVLEIAEKDITPVRSRDNDFVNEVARLQGDLVSLLTLDPLAQVA